MPCLSPGGLTIFGLHYDTHCIRLDDDYVFFNSPALALVKTSTMFVGELEFSDIPVNLDGDMAPVRSVFYPFLKVEMN